MPEGIYSAAAGMAAQQTKLDALANDVANVNTTGYKQQRLGFRDLVYQAQQGMPIGAGSAPVDLGRSFVQGPLQETGDTLAVAIVGPGFFQVRRPDGSVALSRDGRFALDANGAIVTSTGGRLVPPLTVPKGTDASAISIGPDGAVSVGGTSIGKLSIVDVTAPGSLLPAGDNLFTPTAGSGAPKATVGTTVQQGYLEGSNADIATAMTDMIEAQRGYELASRMIKTQDQLLDEANQLVR
jgi:flagellar basal-body rod protein FlgG